VGKLILISGHNGSGKSLFAEKLISQTEGARYYIATMHSATAENRMRIEKHKLQRMGLGFQTLERYYEVGNEDLPEGSVVLLEDISNLLSNVVFEKRGNENRVLEDICRLMDKCRILVAVTISGLEDNAYTGETAAYIKGLNSLNRKLFELASVAVTMRDNLPVYQKGGEYEII